MLDEDMAAGLAKMWGGGFELYERMSRHIASSRPALRRVQQENPSGCGVACVAMLARITYAEALDAGKLLLPDEDWDDHHTDGHVIRVILRRFDLRLARFVETDDWENVPDAICLLAVQEVEDEWHWVVSQKHADGLFFFDPRKDIKTERRRDFDRVRLSGYHRVEDLRE